MAQQSLNYGSIANDDTGDGLRDTVIKIDQNTTELYSYVLDNMVVINNVSDFGTISSDKIYFVKGMVNTGNTTINIPEGVSLNIIGHNYLVSGLYSTEDNYTMFEGNVNGVSNVFFRNIELKASGLNSKLLNIKGNTGFEVLVFESVNFTDCSGIGVVDSFRQGEEYGTGRFGGTPKLEFSGNWLGGYLIDRCLVRNLNDASTDPLFKAGVGLVFNSRFESNANIDLGTNGFYLDFSDSNFATGDLLQLKDGILTRDGDYETDLSTVSPNIDEKNNKSIWTGNVGIPNTYKGGVLSVTTQAVTSLTLNIWNDLQGLTTITKNQHTDNPLDGQMRSLSSTPVDYNSLATFNLIGTADDNLEMRAVIFRNATSTFEFQDVFSETVSNNAGGSNDIAKFLMFDNFTLYENDYVKYEIRNTTASRDVTAIENKCKFKLSE